MHFVMYGCNKRQGHPNKLTLDYFYLVTFNVMRGWVTNPDSRSAQVCTNTKKVVALFNRLSLLTL